MSNYTNLYYSLKKQNEEQAQRISSDAFQAKDAYTAKKQPEGMQRKQPKKTQMQEGGGDREEVFSASQAEQISETLRSL
jgi:ribonuclease HIII